MTVMRERDPFAFNRVVDGEDVLDFARKIMHGDDEHRAWLHEAAQAYVDGQPLPAPRDAKPAPPTRQQLELLIRSRLELQEGRPYRGAATYQALTITNEQIDSLINRLGKAFGVDIP